MKVRISLALLIDCVISLLQVTYERMSPID
jgi:hypothetical protein